MREDKIHQQVKQYLLKAGLKQGVDFEEYVTKNPDYIFENYGCIGEIKAGSTTTHLKSAFKEIKERKGKYAIKNWPYFFILTDQYIRVYKTEEMTWVFEQDKDRYTAEYKYTERDLIKCIEFIKSKCAKVSIQADLSEVAGYLLNEPVNMHVHDLYILLTNLDEPITYSRKLEALIINQDTENEYVICNLKLETYDKIIKGIVNKYTSKGQTEEIKKYLQHNYTNHLTDTKRSNLGKYYTPEQLVDKIKEVVSPHLKEDSFVMDIACGCGAFLESFKEYKLIGRDIDENAIEVVNLSIKGNFDTDNSLKGINRAKYNLKENDPLIIVGNPPYNDTTSKNKRYGTNAKAKEGIEMDEDVKSKDLGRSFLKAYAKLSPDCICVLHPLSYLSKPTNFKSLGDFSNHYRLEQGIILSSRMFPDLKKTSEFPVLLACYVKGAMTYEEIRQFNFKLLNEGRVFKLAEIKTIDDLEEAKYGRSKNRLKYVRKENGHVKKSDINLYQYNIRDTNSLKTSGNLTYNEGILKDDYCTVMLDELPYFAYNHNYRKYFASDYKTGNLSPVIWPVDFKDQFFLDLMVMATVVEEKDRIPIFDPEKEESIFKKHYYLNMFNQRLKTDPRYQIFIDYIENNNRAKAQEWITEYTKRYFRNLKLAVIGE